MSEVAARTSLDSEHTVATAIHRTERFPLVDQLRGIAVVLMVIYHFSYNLTMFRYIEYQTIFDWPLYLVQRACIITFLACVGISLCLVHVHNGIRWRSFGRRELQVGGAALAVTLGTYFTYPQSWVYFGILHFVTLASLLALPLVRWPRLALVLGLALLIPYWFWDYTLPWFTLSHAAFDYVALFPWFGYVLLGITAYHVGLHRWWHLPDSAPVHGLELIGKHTLVIYLLHQPILLGVVWGYYQLTHV